MRNFKKLDIWSDSISLARDIYSITGDFPNFEKYGLVSQIRRAAISISSNIAEGCSGSDSQMLRYLHIAIGSSYEMESQLVLASELDFIDTKSKDQIIELLNRLQRRILAFRKSLIQSLQTN